MAAWAQRDALASAASSEWTPLSSTPSKLAGAWTDEKPTPQKDATSYNNFYEFGVGKDDPARYAHVMSVDPWTVEIEGLVHKPGKWALEDLLKLSPMEERIYRLRCVEGWSMVIPWIGYSCLS